MLHSCAHEQRTLLTIHRRSALRTPSPRSNDHVSRERTSRMGHPSSGGLGKPINDNFYENFYRKSTLSPNLCCTRAHMNNEAKMNYEHQTDELRQPNGIGARREAQRHAPLTTHQCTNASTHQRLTVLRSHLMNRSRWRGERPHFAQRTIRLGHPSRGGLGKPIWAADEAQGDSIRKRCNSIVVPSSIPAAGCDRRATKSPTQRAAEKKSFPGKVRFRWTRV